MTNQNRDVDYGGASDPGLSTASNFGVGLHGQGVLPGANLGYYGPTYNVGYYGPQSGYGERQNTPYSPNNDYRPQLGDHHRAQDFLRGGERGWGNPGDHLHDTLSVDDGSDFAATSGGEGDSYYGPSYDWGRGQDAYAYRSFGSDRGYGPGNWFNPETSPDYGGQRPPHSVGSTRKGYGQPFSAGADYLGTHHINERSGEASEGLHYRGVGPRNYRRSDERIREDVNEALTDDMYLNASDIDVRVHDAVVTLVGTVTDRRQKRRARDVAYAVRGVRDVENLLHLDQPGKVVGAGAETVRGR